MMMMISSYMFFKVGKPIMITSVLKQFNKEGIFIGTHAPRLPCNYEAILIYSQWQWQVWGVLVISKHHYTTLHHLWYLASLALWSYVILR